MRNFRKAALAGATAVAMTFGTTAVATAAPADYNNTREVVAKDGDKQGGTAASRLGSKLDAFYTGTDGKTYATGVKFDEFTGKWDQDGKTTPAWAKVAFLGGIFAMVSAAVGLIVGPAYNFVVHGAKA